MRNNKEQDNWLNASGPTWDNASGGVENWYSADNQWNSAEGHAPQHQVATSNRTSAPYIIQIVNACTTAISSVDVGDSYNNRAASNFNQNSNITITSVITGVNYIEWLAQTESQPMRVGRTMIVCTTAAQPTQTVAVTHRDANGNRADKIISPIVDPYQTQTDRIIDDYEYLFDGYTRLRFNQINASATVTLYLFPISKFVATQMVAGRPAQQIYNAPHIIKVAPVAVARPGFANAQ